MAEPLSLARATAVVRESPLHAQRDQTIESDGLSIRELPIRTLLNLRGDPRDGEFARAVGTVAGLALPDPNRFSADRERLLVWLGPDEFLFACREHDGGGSIIAWRAALAGVDGALTEVGAGHTTLEFTGANAAACLARGWALDLHPRAFPSGHCAQSHLAKAPALLLHRAAPPVYELIVRRSFAAYVWAWLKAGETAR